MAIPLTGAIQLPDGSWIRGRALSEPVCDQVPPDTGLYLGTTWARHRYGGSIHWDQRWLTWPDFLLPLRPVDAVDTVMSTHRRLHAGQRIEVACAGGLGRTGTVLAAFAVLAGLDPTAAVAWVRRRYRDGAVETPWQRRWVARFASLATPGP